jgi:hypothetical protein
VQWWEEWQLRILALGSLGVQFYLALFASCRKKQIWPLHRLLIWLAYLGGDALAIYALATLFNHQRKSQHEPVNCSSRDVKNESRDLEVLWAPVLLMHLGGQFSISAYNIEDNELWRRHILTALSQVRKQYTIKDDTHVIHTSPLTRACSRLVRFYSLWSISSGTS